MLIIGNREITGLRVDGKSISNYYHVINGELKILWQAVKSCFGSGIWSRMKPWSNNESWKK